MNYKFNLDFITNEFTVDKEIKLSKNSNRIDKFYFDIFSGLAPRKLIMTFTGFDKTINFEIFLKNNLIENEISTKTIFNGIFTVDNRITKNVYTSYLIFKILDENDSVIGTSTKIPIKIVNSMITDDCGGQIGIIDHRDLKGRDYPEQHPAESIIGVEKETVEEDLKELYKKNDDLVENIEQNLNDLNNTITETKEDLTKEINRVESESKNRDVILQENIDKEAQIRTQNDKILNDKISVENRERQNEDRILGERIDNLTTQTSQNLENLNNDLNDKLEQEKRERIAEDTKLENKKINITQIGNSVAPLGQDNVIPRRFLPETLFKSFRYFETILDRDSSNPVENDWVYVNETKKFYVFITNWKPIELLEVIVNAINIDFDNANTNFQGSNVQVVLQEISNLFNENGLDIENIKADIEKLKEFDKEINDKFNKFGLDFESYKNETNRVTNNLTTSVGNVENRVTLTEAEIKALQEFDKELSELKLDKEIFENYKTTNDKNISDLQNDKLDKTEFETYKSENNIVTTNLTTTVGNLETNFNETLKNYVKEIKIKDDVLTTNNSLIDLTDKIKQFVASVTLEMGTTDQITLLLNNLEAHINSAEPHTAIKIKLEEIQNNLINFRDLLITQIQIDIATHNNDISAHSELFKVLDDKITELKTELNALIDTVKADLEAEIEQIKLDVADIKLQIEVINQKFEDLGDVVEGGVTDTDVKIANHNTSETAHTFIQNKITNLGNRVSELEPKAFYTSQNSIEDFIANDPEANKIQSGNLVILRNKESKTEIYQFFTTASIVEPKVAEGWDNPKNYVPLQYEVTLNQANETTLGIVGIGANIQIDDNGFIYLNDASIGRKGLVQLGTLEELNAGSTTKVFTGKEIKDYFASKIPVPALNADVTTGTDPAKYITPATLPIKSVTTGNGLTLTNKVLSFDQSKIQFAEEKTYAELELMVSANHLIPGKNYIISDFKYHYKADKITSYGADGDPVIESVDKYGNTERIILTAISANKFSEIVYSVDCPSHILHYEFTKTQANNKGEIYRRIDLERNIDVGTDFINYKYYVYKFNGFPLPNIGEKGKGNILYQNGSDLLVVKYDGFIRTSNLDGFVKVGNSNEFMPPWFPALSISSSSERFLFDTADTNSVFPKNAYRSCKDIFISRSAFRRVKGIKIGSGIHIDKDSSLHLNSTSTYTDRLELVHSSIFAYCSLIEAFKSYRGFLIIGGNGRFAYSNYLINDLYAVKINQSANSSDCRLSNIHFSYLCDIDNVNISEANLLTTFYTEYSNLKKTDIICNNSTGSIKNKENYIFLPSPTAKSNEDEITELPIPVDPELLKQSEKRMTTTEPTTE